MPDRKFLFATMAAFIVSFVLGFIFHGLVLASEYSALTAVYRGPQVGAFRFSLLVLAQILMAAAMVGIYRFGMQEKPYLGQGLRFGLLVACASVIPCYTIGYVVTRIPGALAFKQIVFETIIVVGMAIVIAWTYRR
jgi:hypothetical protein